MFTRADMRRRRYGAFFLVLAAGLLIGGQTLLKSRLTGWVFVFYWGACFLFTGLAMLAALLDVRAVRRDVEEEHHHLVKRIFEEPVARKSRNNHLHPSPESLDRFPK
jgi:hypothetical protein